MGGTEGRALHLLDVEYLGCGPTLSADDLALVLRTYRVRADWHVGDHLVGAASTYVYEQLAFGVQAFKLAGYSLWPFGRVVVTDPGASAALGCAGNVLWLVLAGWWLAIGHVVTGIALCLTIIGIPLGVANFKLALLALVPFGKAVVPIGAIAGRHVYVRGPEPIG